MFGERLPRECDDCGNDCSGLYDHADDCDTGQRLAERQLERLEEKIGTAWEVDSDQKHIDKIKEKFDL